MNYSDKAIKKITSAIPTIDADQNVIKWEVELEYCLNDYCIKYISIASIGDIVNNLTVSKKPTEYSVSELMTFARENHFDNVFNSMYEFRQNSNQSSSNTILSNFDISSLIPKQL